MTKEVVIVTTTTTMGRNNVGMTTINDDDDGCSHTIDDNSNNNIRNNACTSNTVRRPQEEEVDVNIDDDGKGEAIEESSSSSTTTTRCVQQQQQQRRQPQRPSQPPCSASSLSSSSVVSDRGVFWVSFSSDESQLVQKLDQLVEEQAAAAAAVGNSSNNCSSSNADDNHVRPSSSSSLIVDSFRIVNTHDITNLRSHRPIDKLTSVFDKLASISTSTSTTTTASTDHCDHDGTSSNSLSSSLSSNNLVGSISNHNDYDNGTVGIRQLFFKMSLQTESFQRVLHSAVRRGLFSSVTLQGDYRNVAMEVRTIQHLLYKSPPVINRGNWYCPDSFYDDDDNDDFNEQDVGCEDNETVCQDNRRSCSAKVNKFNEHFLRHPMDKLSLICMSLNSDVISILGDYLKYANAGSDGGDERSHVHGSETSSTKCRHGRTLKSLVLNRTDIENVQALADGISKNDTLEEISITHARLEDDHLVLIVEALIDRLNRQNLTEEQQECHGQQHACVQQCVTDVTSNIKTLSLEGNSIGPRTLQALVEYLSHPLCRLEYLNIGHQLSIQPIGAPLPLPPQIKSCLRLLFDGIRSRTNSHIIKDSTSGTYHRCRNSNNTSLKTLNLSGNWLTSEDTSMIWNGISAFSVLENLDLSSNRIDSIADWYMPCRSGTVTVQCDEKQNPPSTLKRLDLTSNPIWKTYIVDSDPDRFDLEHSALWDLIYSSERLGYLGVILPSLQCTKSSKPQRVLFTPHVQHALNMNKAGRNRLSVSRHPRCLPQSMAEDDSMEPGEIPVRSFMPLVLKRSQMLFGDDSVGQEAFASVAFEFIQNQILFDHLISSVRQ